MIINIMLSLFKLLPAFLLGIACSRYATTIATPSLSQHGVALRKASTIGAALEH
jgi:hypothetical protein